MKKIFLVLGFFASVSQSFSQDSWGGVELESTLDPKKSNGFLRWDKLENQTYMVRVYETLLKGEKVIVDEIFTNKNFVRLKDEYLDDNNHNFVIFNSTNVPGPAEIEVPTAGDPATPIFECSKSCNGKDYAYSLVKMQNYTWQQDPITSTLIPIEASSEYIKIEDGGGFYLSNGSYVDFSRFMGHQEFLLARDYFEVYYGREMRNFTEVTDFNAVWDYRILQNISYADQIFDSEGVRLTGTVYAMKKRAFYYDWMIGNRTTNLISIDDLCGYDLKTNSSLWVTTYNAHQDFDINLEFPGGSFYSQDLGCIHDPLSAGWKGPKSKKGDKTFGFTAERYDFDCGRLNFDNISNLNNFLGEAIDCWKNRAVSNAINENGGNDQADILAYNIVRVDSRKEDEEVYINLRDYDNNFSAFNLDLISGLYEISILFEGGVIVPVYIEHDASKPRTYTNASFATITILDNPIKNNKLAFKIEASKKMSYHVTAKTLDGQVLLEENNVISAGATRNVNLNITNKNVPYNQIIVIVSFEDGSTIQKIVLTQ